MIYGYDAIYSLVKALDKMGTDRFLDYIRDKNSSGLIKELNKTLIENTMFIGATGCVKFDKYGDRIDGLYSYGNVMQDGTVDYFGYFFFDPEHGTTQFKMDTTKIYWPSYFTEHGMIPKSDVLIHEEVTKIYKPIWIVMNGLLALSILFLLGLMLCWVCFHSNVIILAAS